MELIITEKPSSAKKIAEAIADKKPTQKTSRNKVRYYELTHNKQPIVVVSAVGHLYTVAEKKKNGWTYPVFDTQWVPSYEKDKSAAFTKKYLTTIQTLAKKADTFTIATDYDIEGEVIGYTILTHACKQTDGQRMKFSTVTKKDLQKSYEQKKETIAWGQAHAGVTRHELDWYYGINLSRALTSAVKAAGGFKLLSSGRVQTPALKILADKEREIQAFKPTPYWQITITAEGISFNHETDKFWNEAEAQQAYTAITDTATITDVETNEFTQAPPTPFDLTTLQTEAYRSFHMSPKETMSHAQDLYAAGYISYPRTSSQQLPPEIGYTTILEELKKQGYYEALANKLLNKKHLRPNNGKKTDPAHPAIFPTGETPSRMNERASKVYDLIVRRFLATFGPPAKRETMTIRATSGEEPFMTKGTRTTEPGWHEYYGQHVKLKEEELPRVTKEQTLRVDEKALEDKETSPPKRYTPSSIIKELEKRGLGTKATRADIIESLFNRGYMHEESIQVNELGLRTIETLEKHVPEIIDEQLTKTIEEELEKIREEQIKPSTVLNHAKKHLTTLLERFKKEEAEIGKELLAAHRESQDARSTLGDCPACDDGQLQIRKGRFGLFIGCTNYPDCKQTYPLPKGGLAKPAGKMCEKCGHPMIILKRARSKPQTVCINQECETKFLTSDSFNRKTMIENETIPCPKCENRLVVRKSTYGEFIGCSAYPKCRYTEKLEQQNNE